MEDVFRKYAIALFDSVPSYIYWGLLSLFCIGTLVLCCSLREKRGLLWSMVLLLVEFFFLILSSTVFFRSHSSWEHNLTPFWSYTAFLDGEKELLVDNLFNVAVFIPIGILLSVIMKKAKWWQVMLIGLTLSVTIETLQFFFKRGFTEFDDVIHNTLGCLIGVGVFTLISSIWKVAKKKRVHL